MDEVIERFEELSARRFVGAAVIAIALPLVGTVAATGLADIVLVALAAVLGAMSGWLGWRRHQISALPLEISRHALSDAISGHPVYRFRVRLGRGRAMREPRADVRFRADDGDEVPLAPMIGAADVLLGPWTLLVEDPDGRCERPGTFVVRVTARERRRSWSSEASWARQAVRPGRFAPGVRLDNGRLRWVRDGWDDVVGA